MDIAISALALALVGLGFALYAVKMGLSVALHPKRKRPIPNGLYRMRKISEEGIDSIFEIEEVSKENEREANSESEKTSKTPKPRRP